MKIELSPLCRAILAFVALLSALPLLWLWPRAKPIETTVTAIVARKTPTKRTETKRKLEKTKMKPIALGQTARADFVSTNATTDDYSGYWKIYRGETIFCAADAPNGGMVAAGGMVTVPVNPALIGSMKARYVGEEISDLPGSYEVSEYEFEVVCIDGEIRIYPASD